MRLSLISVLVIAFSATSLVSAGPIGSTTTAPAATGTSTATGSTATGSTTTGSSTGTTGLSGNDNGGSPSTHSQTTASSHVKKHRMLKMLTEDEKRQVDESKVDGAERAKLEKYYSTLAKSTEPKGSRLNGGAGSIYVIVKEYDDVGEITIKSFSNIDWLRDAVWNARKRGRWVKWAEISETSFLIARKYQKPQPKL